MKVRVAHSMGLCSANPDEQEKRRALRQLRDMEQEQLAKEQALDAAYERSDAAARKLYQRGRVGRIISGNSSPDPGISTVPR